MGKEEEKRPIPNRSEWSRGLGIALCLVGIGAGAGVGIAAFHGLLEQKPTIEKESQITSPFSTPEKINQKPLDYKDFLVQGQALKTKITHIEVFRNLSQQYPEVWKELPSRVEKVIAYVERTKQIQLDFTAHEIRLIQFSNLSAHQDYLIFRLYEAEKGNLRLTKENLLFALARYELEYAQPIEQNPNFQRALKELTPAIRVVNEILADKVSVEEFLGIRVPQIPENLQENLAFGNHSGALPFFSEIFVVDWVEDLFKNSNPENYQPLLKYLAVVVSHELIHAWPQALFLDQPSIWYEVEEKEYEIKEEYEVKKGDTFWQIAQDDNNLEIDDILEANSQIEDPNIIYAGESLVISRKEILIPPQNREFHLAHMSMCSLTAPTQEKLGFEPGIEPRIIYIYSRLKENGVEDPYGLIVQAGATMKGKDLWRIYESVRKEGDLSLDKLIATNDPDPDFSYYTSEEREAFRAEYISYFSQK